MSLFLGQKNFAENLKSLVKRGVILGTFAGLILLSNELEGPAKARWTSLSKLSKDIDNMFYLCCIQIGGLDITTSRNSFGRQVDSFEAILKLKETALCDSNQPLKVIKSLAPLTNTQ